MSHQILGSTEVQSGVDDTLQNLLGDFENSKTAVSRLDQTIGWGLSVGVWPGRFALDNLREAITASLDITFKDVLSVLETQ